MSETPTVNTKGSILSQIGNDSVMKGTGFDRTKHMPPRLNNKGLNIDARAMQGNKLRNAGQSNILETSDKNSKIPDWWTKTEKSNLNGSRTEMIQRRREMGKPDLSYDLDGDGVVGNRDFVLAKIFDKDQDGKLNQQERKQAEEAIKAGFD
jgi:hypothetical protein